MPDISILLVGDTDRSEFREARAVLDESGPVLAAPDMETALGALAEGRTTADLIVLAQAYPEQFSHEQVDRLRRLAPLARVVGLLGSWCEGETRSGRPWPGSVRVYWHGWESHVRQEIARLRAGASSIWSLPVTASEEERLLQLAAEPPGRREGLIAVATPEFAMQDWLRSACRRRGYSSIWILPHRPAPVDGVTAAVFDGNDCGDDELASLARLADALSPAPILVLLDFPRAHQRDRARAAGARAVLAKPFLIADLFARIDRLVQRDPVGQPT